MGFHEEVPRSRRNPATRSLAQFVKCPQVPKSVKTSECYAIGGAQAGRIRKVLRRNSRASPRRSHGERCFLGLAIDASSRYWEYSGVTVCQLKSGVLGMGRKSRCSKRQKGSAGETNMTRNHCWNFVDITRLHAFHITQRRTRQWVARRSPP